MILKFIIFLKNPPLPSRSRYGEARPNPSKAPTLKLQRQRGGEFNPYKNEFVIFNDRQVNISKMNNFFCEKNRWVNFTFYYILKR